MLKTELFTSNSGNSRQVSTEIELLAVLRYYATGCIQVSAGDLHGLSQLYVSRLIRHVSRLLPKNRQFSGSNWCNRRHVLGPLVI